MPAVTPWTGPPRQLHRGPTKPGVHSHNLRRRPRSRHQPVLRALRVLFLLAGLAGIGYYGYSLADQYVYQAYANWTFDQEIAGHHVTFIDYLRAETPLRYIAPAPPPAPTIAEAPSITPEPGVIASPRPAAGDLLGRLEIPRLRLAAIVREGVDDDTLRSAVGHIPSTALPGEAGNFSIAAHRDTLFRALKNIRQDDRVTFQSENHTFTYEVVSTRIVKPTDVSVLKPEPDLENTPQKTLTMITCYPFYFVGSAPERFIVKARLVEDQPETGVAPAPPPALAPQPVARPSPVPKPIASAQHRPRPIRAPLHAARSAQLAKVGNPPNSSRHNVGFWHKLANVFTRRSD